MTSTHASATRLVLLFLCASVLAIAGEKPTALERYATLRQQAQKAYTAKDYRAAREAFLALNAFGPGRPSTIYNLACVNALLGEKSEALRWLDLFARMGQVADAAKDPDLASVAVTPEFKKIAERMAAKPTQKQSSQAWTSIAGAKLVEDIVYDPQTQEFFTTSLIDKKILRIDKDKKVTVAADLTGDPGWPVFTLALQCEPRRVLWVAASAMPDFAASPKQDWGKSVLLKLDVESGKILDRFVPKDDGHPHVLGDMTVSSSGDIVVSDGIGGAVYLLKSGEKELRQIDAGEFVSPQTPAFTPDGKSVLVADYLRGIGRIQLASGSVSWLKAPEDVAVTGVDGLYLRGSQLYGVQNGTNPVRLVRFAVNSDFSKIEGVEVLGSVADAVDINHGAFKDSSFYYIANAGWDALDDHGNRKPDAKATIPEIRVLPDVLPREVKSKR